MKKLLLTLLIAATGIATANAQQGTYQDEQGDYHYETREQKVWIPEQRTGGVFGVGGRTIPGHYETRAEQVKIYNNQYQNQQGQYNTGQKGWAGKHPHGMPPGQRKKLNNGNYYPADQGRNDDRWNDDTRNSERQGHGNNKPGKNKKK